MARPNRTDLAVPTPSPQPQGRPNGKPQAIQLPTGTGYGERQQLQQAQQAVPLPRAPGLPAPVGQGQGPPTLGQALDAAKNFPVMPGHAGAFTRQSERPNEPVTAGLAQTAVPAPGTQPQGGMLASMLSRVAQASGSAALSQLAQRATTLGQ